MSKTKEILNAEKSASKKERKETTSTDPKDQLIAELTELVVVTALSTNRIRKSAKTFLENSNSPYPRSPTDFASTVLNETSTIEIAFSLSLNRLNKNDSNQLIIKALNGQGNKIIAELKSELSIPI